MHGPRYRILIAERNPHVRDFISRELAGCNFLVQGARNSDEVFSSLDSLEPPDLIVLAADTPNTGNAGLLERIADQYPRIPVVLHVYHEESTDPEILRRAAGIVEKNGNPARLTETVRALLSRTRSDSEDSMGDENRGGIPEGGEYG